MTCYLSMLMSTLMVVVLSLPAEAQMVGANDINNNAVRSRHIEKGCQRRTKIPPMAGVKIHHIGIGEGCS